MQTAIQDVEQLLSQLPKDSTLEDIQYHLYVMNKVRKGIAIAEEQGAIPQEEAEERLNKWLIK